MIPTVAVTRYVTPLREGGSLPGIVEADDLGTYVCKFRGAGQGVRVLVAEVIVARAGRADRAAHPAAGGARPRPGHRPLRGRRGGPGPAQRQPGAQPRHRLPARLVRLRRPVASHGEHRPGAGALARRVLRQRRPLLAQPQPAALARRPLGDRPRRRALLPPRLGRRRQRPGAVRRPALERGRPRVPRARATSWPGVDAELRGLLDESVFAEVLAEVPDAWLEPVPGAETRTRVRAAYVDVPDRPPRHPPVAARRWRHDGAAELLPTSTSSCAASRASTARSSSTSAWCCTARPPTSSTSPGTSTATGCAPWTRGSTSTRSARPWPSSRRVCAGDPTAGARPREPLTQRFGFLKAPRSTVLQPGPVHGGVTADPARQLERLLEQLVG